MVTETELIKKIKKLKDVKPRKDWVLLTKNKILGQEPKFELFPFLKPAYAGLFLFLLLIGVLEFSQKALPGDIFYPLKRITEKTQTIIISKFISDEQKSRNNLELANKRLDELNEIAKSNETKKLSPAITEFKITVSAAAKDLGKVKKVNKEILAQTQKLEENKAKVENLLATKIETEEYDNALSQLVEREIEDLESRTLSQEQEAVLLKAKEDFEAGNYSEALIKILDLSQKIE